MNIMKYDVIRSGDDIIRLFFFLIHRDNALTKLTIVIVTASCEWIQIYTARL